MVHKHKQTAEKIAARAFAQRYLSDLLPSVFSSLRDGGYFFDPIERGLWRVSLDSSYTKHHLMVQIYLLLTFILNWNHPISEAKGKVNCSCSKSVLFLTSGLGGLDFRMLVCLYSEATLDPRRKCGLDDKTFGFGTQLHHKIASWPSFFVL